VRSPEFIEQAHQQSHAVAISASSSDDQAFIDALSADDE
jgi:Antitoxin MazE-like